MAKIIRLPVRVRKNNKGSYIASVPLKQLEKLSGCHKTHWSYEAVKVNSEGESVAYGWLILEAF